MVNKAHMNRWARAALCGAGAAALWAGVEPGLQRLIGTPYSDVRLLGRAITRRRIWPLVGLPIHMANGAAFAVGLEALGLRGWKKGLAVAEVETVALWPAMAMVDRYHPDSRAGGWPRLVTSPRALAVTMAGHAIFGVAVGTMLERR